MSCRRPYSDAVKWLKLPTLGRARVVDHYIGCARKEDAERLRVVAEAEGFSVRVENPPGSGWVVTVSHVANPTSWYQGRMERKWVAVASTLTKGHYDGWGTEWGPADPPGWRPER